jgi:hypothetical protein
MHVNKQLEITPAVSPVDSTIALPTINVDFFGSSPLIFFDEIAAAPIEIELKHSQQNNNSILKE